MKIKELGGKFKKASIEMARIVFSVRGFLSWGLANVIVSSVWFIPLALGYLFNQPEWYALGVSLFVLMWLPPPIESILVVILTLFFFLIIYIMV